MSDITGTLMTPEEVRKVVASSHNNDNSTRAEGNLDLPEFFSLLYNMLKIDLPSAILVPSYPKYLYPGTEEYNKTMDNPTENFSPTITYEIIRKEPATMGGNKQPFGTGFKEHTPKERRRIGNTNGTQTIIYGQLFDNLVRFNIWSLSNLEAENLPIGLNNT